MLTMATGRTTNPWAIAAFVLFMIFVFTVIAISAARRRR